jgi:hypothetical protein
MEGTTRVRRKKVLSYLAPIVLFGSLIPVLLTFLVGTQPDQRAEAAVHH